MADILIVDNNVHIDALLQDVLKSDNHKVDIATDGKTALNLVAGKKYELAFVDINLADTDGLSLIKNLKIVSPFTLPIVISGNNDFNSAIKAMRAGAYDYFTKPFDIDRICAVARQAAVEQSQMKGAGYAYRAGNPARHTSSRTVIFSLGQFLLFVLSFYAGLLVQQKIYQSMRLPMFIGGQEILYLLLSFASCFWFTFFARHYGEEVYFGPKALKILLKNLAYTYILFAVILFFVTSFYEVRLGLLFGFGLSLTLLYPWVYGIMPKLNKFAAANVEGTHRLVIKNHGRIPVGETAKKEQGNYNKDNPPPPVLKEVAAGDNQDFEKY